MKTKELRNTIIEELTDLGAYLYYNAASGSQYIKFLDPRLGSLRIGDHEGKPHLAYRWNIHTDTSYLWYFEEGDKGVRYYYTPEELHTFYSHIRQFAASKKTRVPRDAMELRRLLMKSIEE